MPGRAMVIVGGGFGSRFGADKLLAQIDGRPLIAHTVDAVARAVDHCVLVCREDQVEMLTDLLDEVSVVPGGATRTQSEIEGLAAVAAVFDLIGIHDGARPLVTLDLVEALFLTAAEIGGAIPVIAPQGTVVTREGSTPVPGAMVAQTPQVFRSGPLLAAYRMASEQGFEGHDTADVVGAFSDLEIAAVPGDRGNIKVTYPDDLEVVRTALRASRTEPR